MNIFSFGPVLPGHVLLLSAAILIALSVAVAALVWTLRNFPGSQAARFRTELELVQNKKRYGELLASAAADNRARKSAEDRLKVSEERLSLAVQASGIGLWDWNIGEDHFHYQNSVLGYLTDEAGKTLADILSLVHPEDQGRARAALADFINGKVARFDFECRMRRKDGTLGWILNLGEVVERNSDNIPVRAVGIQLDITERKHSEDVLKKSRDDARQANRAKSDFLASMSHELRTPLNGVLGMLELMSELENTGKEQREYIETARATAISLLGLINDVLDISRIEAGRLHLSSEAFSFYESLEDSFRMFKLRAGQKGLNFSVDYGDGLPQYVRGDSMRLRQIVVNLIGNAFKFTPTGGTVAVRLRPGASVPGRTEIIFSVSDTGPGIPLDKQSRIFEPFEQLNTSVTARHGGSGLGLSICRNIVGVMGGKIWLESQPKMGSTFSFSVPLDLAEPAAVTEKIRPQESVAGLYERGLEKIKGDIILAEDNSVNQKIVTSLLERRGARVRVASNGLEAISLFKSEKPDLVLMDCIMPEMDGFEATRGIRLLEEQSGERIPVIGLTACVLEEDRKRCFDAGMDDYLAKPFQKADFLSKVEAHLRRKKMDA